MSLTALLVSCVSSGLSEKLLINSIYYIYRSFYCINFTFNYYGNIELKFWINFKIDIIIPEDIKIDTYDISLISHDIIIDIKKV